VWIGEPGGTWSYPKVGVSNVVVGHSNYDEWRWNANWVISWDTSAATSVTNSVSQPRSGGAFSVLDQINSANISTYMAAAAIGRAYIGALAVGTAEMDDLSVTTLKVANQAITIPVGAYTSGGITIGGTTTTLQTAPSIAVTVGKVYIHAGFFAVGLWSSDDIGAVSGTMQVLLKRGTTIVQQMDFSGYINTGTISFPPFVDNPGAGTYTYTVTATATLDSGYSISAKYRGIFAVEIKK
jgi:hypothetical protein